MAKIIAVPYVRQRADYLCGPACIEMAMRWHGRDINQDGIAQLAKSSPEHGTDNHMMVEAAENLGLKAQGRDGGTIQELRNSIDRGMPVIVNYIEHETQEGHYAVVVGYDSDELILRDPWHGPEFRVKAADFDSRWHSSDTSHIRWMMTI